jgi:LytS/YehU family sensor histidine kinase
VNPHFLYNVHNTIAGLISTDPAKAEMLVMLLSRFFRFTLNNASATFHTVGDELAIVDTYLRMQYIRYESRMTYTITADNNVKQMQMPSFILQPLVENAVKHGLEAIPGNGYIDVTVAEENDDLTLTVSDSGPSFPATPGTGLGLQLVMNKLKLLYNDRFTVSWHNTPEKYVRIAFPRHY